MRRCAWSYISTITVLQFIIRSTFGYGSSAYSGGEAAAPQPAVPATSSYGPQLTRFIAAAPLINYAQTSPLVYDPTAPPFCKCNSNLYNAPVCGNDGVTYNSICDLVNAMSFMKNLGFRCESACPCKFDSDEYLELLNRTIRGNFASCLTNGTTMTTPSTLQTALIFDTKIGIRCDSDCAVCFNRLLKCPAYPLDFPPHMFASQAEFGVRPVPIIVTRKMATPPPTTTEATTTEAPSTTAPPAMVIQVAAPPPAATEKPKLEKEATPEATTAAAPVVSINIPAPIPAPEAKKGAEESPKESEKVSPADKAPEGGNETTPEGEKAAPEGQTEASAGKEEAPKAETPESTKAAAPATTHAATTAKGHATATTKATTKAHGR